MSYRIIEKEVTSSDGIHTLYGKVYAPAGEARAIFQVAHGMTEHIERYHEFMAFLAENGFVAFAHDHMGHGKTGLAAGELGFIAEDNGHETLIEDVRAFAEAVKADFPGKKHILMGHSMGSFIVRHYAARYGNELSGLVLMGTGGPNPAASAGITVTKIIKKNHGAHYVSKLIYKLAFGAYNARTKKETEYDWLSFNKENIEKYLADELCGFPFTVSAMQDLIKLTAFCNTEKWAKSMPKSLPIYLVAGSEDPVGEYGEGVKKVCRMLRLAGVRDTKIKLYRGARHEILNEACFPVVCNDILKFAERVI
jgi:alpha-beta hydrolase superfamily lysophospholipase